MFVKLGELLNGREHRLKIEGKEETIRKISLTIITQYLTNLSSPMIHYMRAMFLFQNFNYAEPAFQTKVS